jgi:hypothetical protein
LKQLPQLWATALAGQEQQEIFPTNFQASFSLPTFFFFLCPLFDSQLHFGCHIFSELISDLSPPFRNTIP